MGVILIARRNIQHLLVIILLAWMVVCTHRNSNRFQFFLNRSGMRVSLLKTNQKNIFTILPHLSETWGALKNGEVITHPFYIQIVFFEYQ